MQNIILYCCGLGGVILQESRQKLTHDIIPSWRTVL